MDKIVSLCKRRGFVFQSSEIYGGAASVWDYGPLGVELRRNIADAWWSTMVHARDDIEGLDAGILMHPRVWEASGHVSGFTDPLLECKTCKKRWRADRLDEAGCPRKPSVHPGGHGDCELGEPRLFNLMFKTFMGPVQEDAAVVYLRPETAQGSYVNFLNVQQTTRQRVPFGIAQLGKAFRNEITPGNFIFRTREFEQAEMQFFVKPGSDDDWFRYWLDRRLDWHREIGIRPEKLRVHAHGPGELAHYAKTAVDIEYEFPFGWQELEGVHNRTDFDLAKHQEYSGKRLFYIDPGSGERYVPYVVETAMGVGRTALVALVDAYREEEVAGQTRVVLGLHPALAPIKAAVFPRMMKCGQPGPAMELIDSLRCSWIPASYGQAWSIRRRYRRQDEVGTPLCVTVDFDSLDDQAVTIRERDSQEQIRVPIAALVESVRGKLGF